MHAVDMSFQSRDLRDCDLRDCDLRDCDLRDCDLRDCDLRDCDLRDWPTGLWPTGQKWDFLYHDLVTFGRYVHFQLAAKLPNQ